MSGIKTDLKKQNIAHTFYSVFEHYQEVKHCGEKNE